MLLGKTGGKVPLNLFGNHNPRALDGEFHGKITHLQDLGGNKPPNGERR
jgi:hypothetical protein